MDLTDGPLVMAGAVVALLPVVTAFLIAHRFFWPDEMLLRPVGFREGSRNEDPGSPPPAGASSTED
jgi:hypothetical protein